MSSLATPWSLSEASTRRVAVSPPWGAVFAHSEAHILTDECGAPEFFGGGLKLVGMPGVGCKVSAETLADVIGTRGDAVREMLAARLQSFEEMFNHGGAELAERIARDSTTLGNLITRHLGEFDRTVKTYGGEMVERLGDRTQEVVSAMREYLENFDTRVSTKTAEVSAGLDQASRFTWDRSAELTDDAIGKLL